MVYKNEATAGTLPDITRIEYFIDTDPGVGQATAIPFATASNVEDLSAIIDVTGLANGGHYFFVRSMDANGKYSITGSKYFEIDNTPLPLTLLGYNAQLENAAVKNHWTTANETNTSHFVIERSANGIDFTATGKTEAKNTAGQHDYYFTDHLSSALLSAPVLYYRLQQVDAEGKSSYSQIIPVKLNLESKIAISPNPATDYIHVFAPRSKSLSIISMNGTVVFSTGLNPTWDSTTVRFGNLAKGIYLVKITDTDTKTTVEKILVR